MAHGEAELSKDRHRLPLNALRAFEAVARNGSFTAGASALSVTQSAASRHVALLEQIIGRKLFDRDVKGASLTEAGQVLLPAVTRAFDGVSRALERVGALRALRVHIPPGFLQGFALPIIQAFRAAHPEVSLTIVSSNGTGLSAEEFDVSVTFDLRERHIDDDANLLWPIEVTPACSPDFAASLQEKELADIVRSDSLLHVRLDGRPPTFMWSEFAAQLALGPLGGGGLVLETTALAVEFARNGAGIALADLRMFGSDLRDRSLVAPFGVVADTGFGYYLTLAPSARSQPSAVLLHDWMKTAFRCSAAY